MSVNCLVVHFHLNNCSDIIYRENKPWLSCITASLNSPFLFKSASAHFFSEWCHKYKQNVKIAGQAAASQITVININLFPTSRLSYSFCIIKLSSGRNGEEGGGGYKGKGKKGDKHSWNLRENVFLFKLLCKVTECNTVWSLLGVWEVFVLSWCMWRRINNNLKVSVYIMITGTLLD